MNVGATGRSTWRCLRAEVNVDTGGDERLGGEGDGGLGGRIEWPTAKSGCIPLTAATHVS